jgi:hypothetical protein
MDQAEYDRLLRYIRDALLDLWNRLSPRDRAALYQAWLALLAALNAARAAGLVGASTHLGAVLNALRAFLGILAEQGLSGLPISRVKALLDMLKQLAAQAAAGSAEVGAAGTEAGAAGAGLTASAVLLVLVAILSIVLSIYHIVLAKGPTSAAIGGPPCGPSNPIARGLLAEGYSHFGQRAAFKAAEEAAREAAQGFTCQETRCASGKCRGNCAITDISYKYRIFWTWCNVTYDVWCECY